MAPDARLSVEEQLRTLISTLYSLMRSTYAQPPSTSASASALPSGPNNASSPSGIQPSPSAALATQVHALVDALIALVNANANLRVEIPLDLIEFVETSRNPDIYTRQFVEAAQAANQRVAGRCRAFAEFRDVLAKEIAAEWPEVKGEVEALVRDTGGAVA